MSKSVFVLFPNQLFPIEILPLQTGDQVVLVEDPLFFGMDPERASRFHKQKLVLLRASAKRYATDAKIEVLPSLLELTNYLEKQTVNSIQYYEPSDHIITRRMEALGAEAIPSPQFVLSEEQARELVSMRKTAPDFYSETSRTLGLEVSPSPKVAQSRLPLKHMTPEARVFGNNSVVRDVASWVTKHFSDNFGEVDTFQWPTHRSEALILLKQFVRERLGYYAQYEMSIEAHNTLMFHSGLSAMLNIGLLVIRDIIDVLDGSDTRQPSIKRFLYNLLGEREYVRALYLSAPEAKYGQAADTLRWQEGIGLPPVDDVIHKAALYGYATYSERQILHDLLELAGVNSYDQYQIYMGAWIDAFPWAVEPWVFQSSKLHSSPMPIVTAKTIQSLSASRQNSWTKTWEGLYWHYIDSHRRDLSSHPTTAMMIRSYDRMDDERKAQFSKHAETFLKQLRYTKFE